MRTHTCSMYIYIFFLSKGYVQIIVQKIPYFNFSKTILISTKGTTTINVSYSSLIKTIV